MTEKPPSKTKTRPQPTQSPTTLDPDHPNHDSIVARRERLERFRKRRKANGKLGSET